MAFATLLKIIVIGCGIYLLILGQDCRSYANLGCALGVVFGFIVIPYGVVNLFFIELASLPFKIFRLIGSILSALSGFARIGLCCITTLWAFSSEGMSLLSNSELTYLTFPLFFVTSGIALLGVSVTSYSLPKQHKEASYLTHATNNSQSKKFKKQLMTLPSQRARY